MQADVAAAASTTSIPSIQLHVIKGVSWQGTMLRVPLHAATKRQLQQVSSRLWLLDLLGCWAAALCFRMVNDGHYWPVLRQDHMPKGPRQVLLLMAPGFAHSTRICLDFQTIIDPPGANPR